MKKQWNKILALACAAALALSFGACTKKEGAAVQTSTQTPVATAPQNTEASQSTQAPSSTEPSSSMALAASNVKKTPSKKQQAKASQPSSTKKSQSTPPSKTDSGKTAMPSTLSEFVAYYNKTINQAMGGTPVSGTQKLSIKNMTINGGGSTMMDDMVTDLVNEMLAKNTVVFKSLPYTGKVNIKPSDVTSAKRTVSGDTFTITMQVKSESNPGQSNSATARALGYIYTEDEFLPLLQEMDVKVGSIGVEYSSTSITCTYNKTTGRPVSLVLSTSIQMRLKNVTYPEMNMTFRTLGGTISEKRSYTFG